jgi:hypothetical protein
MLISNDYNFCIFNIPKTGTKSIRLAFDALTKQTGKTIINIIGGATTPVVPQHATLKDARKMFERNNAQFDEYKKFLIIRNPWQRYYSLFNYTQKKYKELSLLGKRNSVQEAALQNWSKILERHKDRQEILRRVIIANKPQSDYIFDNDGSIPSLTTIGRFETIEQDINSFLSTINIPPLQLPHENKYEYDYSIEEEFNQELIDLIAAKEKLTIERFDFQPPKT